MNSRNQFRLLILSLLIVLGIVMSDSIEELAAYIIVLCLALLFWSEEVENTIFRIEKK